MTPEQQIKALAELDGWRFVSNPVTYIGGYWEYGQIGTPNYKRCQWHISEEITDNLPNYLTSYDAIIPLIHKYAETCCESSVRTRFEVYETPASLCEALLRATGKWIE